MHHLVIGGGPVATNAIESIRTFAGESDSITLVCDEPAHSRMALPYWLAKQIPVEHTHTADESYFRSLGVDARIGVRAARLDTDSKSVELDNGESLNFDRLLVATGASPLALDIPGADLPGVQSLWTIGDTEALLQQTEGAARPKVAMIGAGFIGFIMLNAMFKRDWDLVVIERESHVLPRMMNQQAATVVERWLQQKGVELQCGASVQSIESSGSRKRMVLDNGQSLEADVVIVAVGIRPNLALFEGTGIKCDQGVIVDAQMRTSEPDVFAGGDIAQGPALFETEKQIHAIQPTAVDHGRVAGANMAGAGIEYPGSLLMNVLDCCGLQCASYGRWNDDGGDETIVCNETDGIYRRFVWEEDRLVGAVFTGRANDVGMLTDVGMVKGILQTGGVMGVWKPYLHENPFDVRRAFVATKVPERLVKQTLLGRPAVPREFRAGDPKAASIGPAHGVYVNTSNEGLG